MSNIMRQNGLPGKLTFLLYAVINIILACYFGVPRIKLISRILLTKILFSTQNTSTNTEFYPVSIAIPLYNENRYLKRSMTSVLNQTLRNIEIVICDDGSTDGSYEYVQDISSKDKRIHLIHFEKNQGTYVARITAVRHSNGQYIFFFDPDDVLALDAAESDYNLAVETDADIVEHQMEIVRGKRHYLFHWNTPNFTVANTTTMINEYLANKLNWNLPRKIIRRTIFMKAIEIVEQNMPDKFLIVSEDLLLMGPIYMLSTKMVVNNRVLYYYYRNPLNSKKRAERLGCQKSNLLIVNKRLSEIFNREVIF